MGRRSWVQRHDSGRGGAHRRRRHCAVGAAAAGAARAASRRRHAGRSRPETPMDPDRARELYVSKDPADHARGYNFKRDVDDRVGDRSAVRQGQPGRHGLQEGDLPQQRRRHGHPGLSLPAAEEARPEGARGDGLGARRRARQLGREHVSVRQGSGRARLRRHLPRVSRQHRLRRGASQRDRLRRLRDRRHDERRRVPEDAAARRSGSPRHHGLEPRRLHHAALGVPRHSTHSRPPPRWCR